MNYKKIYVVLFIIFMLSIFTGVTFSFWQWQSAENTAFVFDVKSGQSCASVDGGGNITSSEIVLAPASCTNSKFAIKREINITPVITDGSATSLDLWLNINNLGTGLSNSQNFRYVLTTSDSSCTDEIIASGNFNGKVVGDTVLLLKEKTYKTETVDTYYLYILLDSAETSTSMMYQTFDLSIGGTCEGIDGSVFDDHTPMITSYTCDDSSGNLVTVGDSPYFTYTGQCEVIDDGDGDWRIKF